jgi:hypothetical protein
LTGPQGQGFERAVALRPDRLEQSLRFPVREFLETGEIEFGGDFLA